MPSFFKKAAGMFAGSALPIGGTLGMIAGVKHVNRAEKKKNEANAQQAQFNMARNKAELFAKSQSDRQAREQEKVNRGKARANRRRVRGGLFGESQQAPGYTAYAEKLGG